MENVKEKKFFQNWLTIIATFFAVVQLASVLSPTVVSAATDTENSVFTDEDIEAVIPIFEAIEEAPDELFETGTSEEIESYFASKGVALNVYNDNIGETAPVNDVNGIQTNRSVGMCVLHLGQLLAMIALPASQITRIRDYISALGGVTMTAKLLVGATTATEKVQVILTGLTQILATISGINGIRRHCLGHNV